jgi:hypothetical protein
MSKEICFIYNSKKMHFRYDWLFLISSWNIPLSVMFGIYILYICQTYFILSYEPYFLSGRRDLFEV